MTSRDNATCLTLQLYLSLFAARIGLGSRRSKFNLTGSQFKPVKHTGRKGGRVQCVYVRFMCVWCEKWVREMFSLSSGRKRGRAKETNA